MLRGLVARAALSSSSSPTSRVVSLRPRGPRLERTARGLRERGGRVETSTVDALVRHESAQHGDMVFADHVDTHRSSNAWLKQAYAWALEHTAAQWFVKTDDDVYVHVQRLSHWLVALDDRWSIVGEINPPGAIRAAEGKTSETEEVRARWGSYAPWPRGSAGHAVTRDLATFVSRLPAAAASFHGEDVSLGLWLSQLDQPSKVRSSELSSI